MNYSSNLRTRISCLLLASAPLCGSAAFGQGDSGFLRGEGKGTLVLTYGQESYDEFWVGTTRTASAEFGSPTRSFYNIYGEYGISDSVDVGLSVTYVDMDGTPAIKGGADIKDLVFFVKARLLTHKSDVGEFSLLAKPGVKLPLAEHDDVGLDAFGDEQVDWQGRLVAQFKLLSGMFVASEFGYDKRNEVAHDRTYFSTTIGCPVTSDFSLSAFYSILDTHGGGDFGLVPLANQEADSTRVGANAYYKIDVKYGMSLTAWEVLDGRNTGDEFGFSVGVIVGW
ncbi:MAG: hypothetical protein ACI87A_003267 [Planctomycetota bacterium]|jgi:hypothetical protein